MLPVIRPATPADLPAILAVAEATWFPTYLPLLSREQVKYMFDVIYNETTLQTAWQTPGAFFILAENEGQPQAFAHLSPLTELDATIKLQKFYVHPQAHGSGLASELMTAVFTEATKREYTHIDLNVNRYNDRAIAFYRKKGFGILYETDVAIGPYWMNDYVMSRSVV